MELIGQTIGNYQIAEEIGRGGMGTVYRAYQTSLNRWVALKVLSPVLAQNDEFFQRFKQEALATAALDHPNIVHVYDAGEEQGIHFIAMEYIGGGNLLTRLKKVGAPLSTVESVSIVAQIAMALDFAHRNKIVHRDVKPSNILLDPEGRAVLSDLGIAHALEGTRLTQTGTTMGTPEYMSPEQAQGKPLDGRADLYSLGIVLFEMLTGRVPFQTDSPLATMYKHIHEPPPDLQKINQKLPAKLSRAIKRALAKDPEQRFASGQQMASDLLAAVPEARVQLANPGATIPKMTYEHVAANALDKVQSIGAQTARGIGRFLLVLAQRTIEAVIAAAVLIALLSALLLIVASFVIAQYAQTTLRDYQWYFAFSSSQPYFLDDAEFKRNATPYITNHTFGAISEAGLTFTSPNQIRLSAKILSNPATLSGIVFVGDGVPQVYVQQFNGMPLPVIDNIISSGVNQGLREGWSKSPLRAKRIVVTDTSLTMEVESK
jgi:serine/threonine-protein kinase